MTRFHFERPDGPPSNNAQNILVPLNEFVPPQGYGVGVAPVLEDPLLALYPPIADNTFQFYKFYQIKKNQVPTTQTNMPLVIIDTVGSGIFQQASGFDVRAFDSNGVPLEYQVQNVIIGTGSFVIWINVTTVKDNEFIQLTFGKPIATDAQNPPAVWAGYAHSHLMNEVPAGVGSIKDSVAIPGDGDPVATLQTPAKVGDGQFFDSTTLPDASHIFFPSYDVTTSFTITMWLQTTTTARSFLFLINDASGGGDLPGIFSEIRATGLVRFGYRNPPSAGGGDEIANSSIPINDGVFHRLTLIYDDDNNELRMRIDKAAVGSAATALPPQSIPLNNIMGSTIGFALALNGILQQFKTFAGVKSIDKLDAEFNNQDNNDAFWFKTPLLENGEDNFLVDDMGRNIVVVGQ